MGRLIAKADALLFEMEDGWDIFPPLRDALLHDPDGDVWPKCSVLVGPFRRRRRVWDEDDPKAQAYFGQDYELFAGNATLPPRELNRWESSGEIERIFYNRKGFKAPGRYKHKFGGGIVGRLLRLFKGRGRAHLYEYGHWLRIELPGGCVVNEFGFVLP